MQHEGLNSGISRRGGRCKKIVREILPRKTQDFYVFRETKAVNEAERVRCADRFLSSLKKAELLTSAPLHLYSDTIYSVRICTRGIRVHFRGEVRLS